MKISDTKEIQSILKKELDTKRFQHTLGVAYTAVSLAMCYDSDLTESFIAGLLHDCAKCISDKDKINFCKNHNIKITNIELQNPFLLHAIVGSVLANEKYGIENSSIENAILYHTTGHPAMTLLEKIIFVADYIEPLREHDSELSRVRQIAFVDIDECLLLILQHTLSYLKSSHKEIDPKTEETYKYYIKVKDNMHE